MKHFFSICLVIGFLACTGKKTKKVEKSSSSTEVTSNTAEKGRVLFIVSNQHTYGETHINAANHFAEIVLAYDVFEKSGFKVDFVSPDGGAIPIGYLSTSDSIEKQYLYDFEFMKLLKNTHQPEEIVASKYNAVYYGGGGAAMFGVPENEQIQKITMTVYEENEGVVSAICHGAAGLVNLKTKEGQYLYKGKKVNGFPDLFENMDALYYQQFPFSIEQIIKERGGNFSFSEEGWDNYFVVDGRLITGQDPTAAASVAKKVVETLTSK